jgi:hypothetical protein
MAMLMWIAPVIQFFAAASFAGGCFVAGLLQVGRSKQNQPNIPPADPNPDQATLNKHLDPYDQDMDEFWKEWQKSPRR